MKTCGTCKNFVSGWKHVVGEPVYGLCSADIPMTLSKHTDYIEHGKWRTTKAKHSADHCIAYRKAPIIELSQVEIQTTFEAAQAYAISLGEDWIIPSPTFFEILFESPKAALFMHINTYYWTSANSIADFQAKTLISCPPTNNAVRCIKKAPLQEWIQWCYPSL